MFMVIWTMDTTAFLFFARKVHSSVILELVRLLKRWFVATWFGAANDSRLLWRRVLRVRTNLRTALSFRENMSGESTSRSKIDDFALKLWYMVLIAFAPVDEWMAGCNGGA